MLRPPEKTMYAIGYRGDRTRNYAAGLYYLVVSTVIAGVAVLLLRRAALPGTGR